MKFFGWNNATPWTEGNLFGNNTSLDLPDYRPGTPKGGIMNSEGLLVKEQTKNGKYRICAIGDLIITNAKGLQRHIDQAIESGSSDVVIDLSEIEYIDSFGIGVVVKTKSEVDKRKGTLLVVVNPTLFNLFEKCHLDDYIDLEVREKPTEEPVEE